MITIIIGRGLLSCMLIFYFLTQPLAFAFILLLTSLLWRLTIGIFYSSWLGFLLFLIYIGGVVIIFAYVTALIPNVLFNPVSKWNTLLIALVPLASILYFCDYSSLNIFSNLFSYKACGVQLVGVSSNFIFIAMALILLFNLVGVIKFCYSTRISLRPFIYA